MSPVTVSLYNVYITANVKSSVYLRLMCRFDINEVESVSPALTPEALEKMRKKYVKIRKPIVMRLQD